MSRIRLGLIGCGGMSKAHLRRFEALSSRLQLTAAACCSSESTAAVASEFAGIRVATDFRQVLDHVDAVLLVLPHHLHHTIGVECLAAGKHVLLRDRHGLLEEGCLQLIEASRKAQRTLMIAYCMRYHPLVVRMKELLDEGVHGDVFQVSIWTEQLTQYPEQGWHSDPIKLGGGQFFSHGCHYVDILLWYLGRPIRGTHLGTNRGTPWMKREGTSNVSIEFEEGRLGYHFGTWGARGSRLRYSFHAHCTEGMIEADISGGRLIAHAGGRETLILQADTGKHTENEMAHFLDCIETGRLPRTNGPDSLQGLRLIWRLYEAEQRGSFADLSGLGLDDLPR